MSDNTQKAKDAAHDAKNKVEDAAQTAGANSASK